MTTLIKRMLIVLLISAPGLSLQAQSAQKALDELDRDFSRFSYREVLKKGEYFLGEAYISQKDSLAIYTYLLNAAYALQDTARARNYINRILDINHDYSMDAKTTSPKIIELFEMVKKQRPRYPKATPPAEEEATFALKQNPTPAMVLSTLVLPGSGHWQANMKPDAYYKSAVSSAWLASIVITSIRTRQLEEDYLSVSQSSAFADKYSSYNRMYKSRNILIAGYIIWGIYNIFDLSRSMPVLQVKSPPGSLSLGIKIPLP
ncbi:MAG TPA: hypothetical protein ENJ10_07655 [Caldithrix abyssi]|uniref:DUF5683 domain-containing protein n=1 Tax=Caldithrix abyssi TaxID=187145 RepID=A0A7V1LM54_CALAY|nr:hypothetical protein [Caldithrix abyssi]